MFAIGEVLMATVAMYLRKWRPLAGVIAVEIFSMLALAL